MPQLDIAAYSGEYIWLVVVVYLLQIVLLRGVVGDIQRQGQIRGEEGIKEKSKGKVVEGLLIEGVMGKG